MDIKTVIHELNNNGMIEPIVETKQLSGGTTSKLYLLHDNKTNQYVVKFNEPHVLEAESHFLAFYKDIDFLPDLLYTDPSHRYIVYTFVSGAVNYPRKHKKEMLQTLADHLINHYRPVEKADGWGWTDEPADSWSNYLFKRANDSRTMLDPYLKKEDHDFVLNLVNSTDRNNDTTKRYLLHGDCGVHNFIFNEGKLTSVIDPTPVHGDPLYDLIYAFCSSPDDLTKETIKSCANRLQTAKNKNDRLLYEEVLIGLYFRMATCTLHHPEDLQEYLQSWAYWKDIVRSAAIK
ncbi:aminoglycoside phosphotransferase family protein [Fictibacillus phosphorivorans]|uniref:aminoglycoside phosphotransferase family protein n=1 Tax=Fictibacillus phosphorivorans TaxID=1221500 RepID=UPI00203A5FFD|nr:aminoglycoside phosphotransferase family protein [Fictibacillus phosphorivorans]MCM3718075.1 aminoglycoside phosphotransferase family protein [Fictibacillus phosphorivorans]MCM3775702.1 aminoglycoside phosphotransferase family protein [Fictibacillus phosphorivorans]